MIALFFVFCFFDISYGQAGPPEVPYMLNFDSSVYLCPDDQSKSRVDASGVEVRSYNDTVSTMTGHIKFHEEIGSNTMIEIIVEKEVSGQFQVMVTHEICDLCEELHAESAYYKYLKHFGFPDNCPFEAGDYPVHDFVPDADDLPVNSANAARYQTTVIFYNNPDGTCKNEKTFMFCLKMDFIIEPAE